MTKNILNFLLLLIPFVSMGITPVEFRDINTSTRILGAKLLLLEDKADTLSFEDVHHSNLFQKVNRTVPTLTATYSAFWIKFQIKNFTKLSDLLLILDYPTIDYVE